MMPESPLTLDLRREWNRCAAEGIPLALLIVALDPPPAGHNGEILAHLDRALRVHCARDRDIVDRRADGIFVALLPDTPPPGARHVGEQIVEAMHHAPEPVATVSVGVAAVVPSENDEATSLLTRAERALHAAQNQGGNRCAGGSTPAPPPKGPLTQLRDLFPRPKKDPAHQRRTD
jgi:PleD family two-component response regulator